MNPEYDKEGRRRADARLRWLTAATLATFLMLCIAVTTFFMFAGSTMSAAPPPRVAQPASSNAPPSLQGLEDTATAPPIHRKQWVTYYDSPIRVTPNVLLCATSGRGADKLATALDTYCTHVIYTGPLTIGRSESSGKLQVHVRDRDGYRVFSGLSRNRERYLSFRWGAGTWNEGDVLQALVAHLRYERLRGVELVMASQMHRTKFIRFCQNFVHKMRSNESLIIKVQRTVELTKGLFERLASIPVFLVLEAQVAQMPDMKSKRYPNPYQPFSGSHNKDVYMRYRLWRVHPWRRQLRVNNVCFTLSMTVIKAHKGPTKNNMLAYSYTGLKEACQQTSMEMGVDWKALSRFRENRTVFYAYDNKQTITSKLWRLSHEFPRYCVAVYDVERDDFEDVCPRKSVPLLRVVRKLVTATAQSRVE
ncbi:uncharacterized protein [Dermacentor albipictus]|uniref:uncharacterized protein isoform X1 n=1 Tax=Dermacentor albipictus TaxID=60249 RepID=UPI0038FD2068